MLVIIKELTDDEAAVTMVDTNIQRENLLVRFINQKGVYVE